MPEVELGVVEIGLGATSGAILRWQLRRNLLPSAHVEDHWKWRHRAGRVRDADRGGDWPSHYPLLLCCGGSAAQGQTVTPPGADGWRLNPGPSP